jgi:hypothetical protein
MARSLAVDTPVVLWTRDGARDLSGPVSFKLPLVRLKLRFGRGYDRLHAVDEPFLFVVVIERVIFTIVQDVPVHRQRKRILWFKPRNQLAHRELQAVLHISELAVRVILAFRRLRGSMVAGLGYDAGMGESSHLTVGGSCSNEPRCADGTRRQENELDLRIALGQATIATQSRRCITAQRLLRAVALRNINIR